MNWQQLLLAVPFLTLLGYQQWLHAKHEEQWMRIFCEKQGINPASMEPERQADPKPALTPPAKRRISIPLPGTALFKRPPVQ